MSPTAGAAASPFRSAPGAVRPEWIDHNGHLNLAYYIVLFDLATDAFWPTLGLGAAYRETGFATFAVEAHTLYLAELLEGDETVADSVVVDADAKRLHVAHELLRVRDGAVAARQELMYLTVNQATRRSVPWPEAVAGRLLSARTHYAALRPPWVGRRVSMPVKQA